MWLFQHSIEHVAIPFLMLTAAMKVVSSKTESYCMTVVDCFANNSHRNMADYSSLESKLCIYIAHV